MDKLDIKETTETKEPTKVDTVASAPEKIVERKRSIDKHKLDLLVYAIQYSTRNCGIATRSSIQNVVPNSFIDEAVKFNYISEANGLLRIL